MVVGEDEIDTRRTVMNSCSGLARDIGELLAAIRATRGQASPDQGRRLRSAMRTLELQREALRVASVDRASALRRRSWALGQTATIVLPSQLTVVERSGIMEDRILLDRCRVSARSLASALEDFALGRD